MGDESDIDSDWECESEDGWVLYGGGVGDADGNGVVGNADVVGDDISGVGDANCGAGSSVVRDGSIEDGVCRDSGDECGGLVGDDGDDQSDNDGVDKGRDGDCLRGDDGGPNGLDGGVHVPGVVRGHGGVRVCGGCFYGVGGSGRHGGHGWCGVCVRGGVHGPGRGLGVRDHGVADLQREPADIADEDLLDDTFHFNKTEGLKVRMNQQQNVLDFLHAWTYVKM